MNIFFSFLRRGKRDRKKRHFCGELRKQGRVREIFEFQIILLAPSSLMKSKIMEKNDILFAHLVNRLNYFKHARASCNTV